MPERRKLPRTQSHDRRSFPRPPLWLTLLLLFLGVAGVLVARIHRDRVESQFGDVLTQQQRTPDDVRSMKDELAEMDLTREQLQAELQARLKFMESLKSENFYLSVDTAAKKLRFYYGDVLLREADVQVGEQATVTALDGRSWTFVPLKGSFPVQGKAVHYDWRVPEWLYGMQRKPIPQSRPSIEGGLGKYVIFLPNGYVIHTTPSEKSPLKGPKPGSFMVADEDFLGAIWPRIHPETTQVYIF
jgi:hypothetical protein